jgi:hypothetical protein
MQYKKNRRNEGGIILIPLLFLVIAIAFSAHSILKLVLKENEEEIHDLNQKQIMSETQSLAKKVLANENFFNENMQLPTYILKPGSKVIHPKVLVNYKESIPLKVVEVTSEYDDGKYSMEFMKVYPPGGCDASLYKYGMVCKNKINGLDLNEINAIDSDVARENFANIPQIDEEGYENYSVLSLPNTSFVDTLNLGDRLYSKVINKIDSVQKISVTTASGTIPSYGGSCYYYIENNVNLKGRGIFFNRNPIIFKSGSSNEGLLWVICGNTVYIENGVNLDKVLIFADGKIIIGKNVSINGIMVSTYDIEIGENFNYTKDSSVLEPFVSTIYHK